MILTKNILKLVLKLHVYLNMYLPKNKKKLLRNYLYIKLYYLYINNITNLKFYTTKLSNLLIIYN